MQKGPAETNFSRAGHSILANRHASHGYESANHSSHTHSRHTTASELHAGLHFGRKPTIAEADTDTWHPQLIVLPSMPADAVEHLSLLMQAKR